MSLCHSLARSSQESNSRTVTIGMSRSFNIVIRNRGPYWEFQTVGLVNIKGVVLYKKWFIIACMKNLNVRRSIFQTEQSPVRVI